MQDAFVFVAGASAPAAAEAEAVQDALDGGRELLDIELDQREALGEPFGPAELAYVESVLGPFRIDTIAYRSTHRLADALERLYAGRPALADADSDAILTVPELVVLLRAAPDGPGFFAWADPARR